MDPAALAGMLAGLGAVTGYGVLTQGTPLPGTPVQPQPQPSPTPIPAPTPAPEPESPEYTEQASGPPPNWKDVIDNVFVQASADEKERVGLDVNIELYPFVGDQLTIELQLAVYTNKQAPSQLYDTLKQRMSLPSLDVFMVLYHDALVRVGLLQAFVSSAEIAKREQCKQRLEQEGIQTRSDFRRWAARNHPDRGGDAQRFQETSECMDMVFPKSGGRSRKNTFRRRRRVTTKKHVRLRRTRRS